MNWANPPIGPRSSFDGAGPARVGVAALVVLMTAGALAIALYEYPPPSLPLLAVGGLGAVGVLALAVARLDAAVALGFVMLGVVKIEPAPVDLIFIAVVAVAAVTGRFDLSRVPRFSLIAVGFFLSLTVLSMIEAVDPYRAAFFASISLYLAVFSIWFAGYLNSPRRARLVVLAYLAIAVLSAALGALALYGGLPGGEIFLYDGARAQALFKDPNVFGPFLIPIALILLEELMQPRLLRMRAATKSLLLMILVLGVVVSFSRAAWLNLAVGIAVILFITLLRSEGARRGVVLLLVLASGGLVVGTVVAATGADDFIAERASVQGYDTERFSAQETGVELARAHPLGIGPGQFDVVSPVAAHSSYVRVLTEQGFVGVLSFLAIAVGTLLMALRNAVIGRDTYGIGSAALLGAWCGLLANSLFVDTLHWRHLWLVAGLIWAGSMRRQWARGEEADPRFA